MAKRSIDDLVTQLTTKFNGILREAVAEGARVGGEEARQKIVAALSEGKPLALNLGAPLPKRDKSPKGNVKCPVPDCTRPGIRPMNCFCQEHYNSLSPEKRKVLRERQLEARKRAKRDGVQEHKKAAAG